MANEKPLDDDSSTEQKTAGIDHVEAQTQERRASDPAYQDHRADDDRAEEAKGRNADGYQKHYWLSVNYIGTLFAIGMAFMGGIGGESTSMVVLPRFLTCP